jgi:glycosyltransferase involved in cell wall biosynthesis
VLDVPAVLAGFDIFVMPSHNEGLPYGLLEAMAAGCAVVAFRVGGIPEVVDDPRLGLLVAPGDVDGFVRAVLELAADPAQQRSLGSAAAAHIPAAFALRDRLSLLEAADHRERGDRGDHGQDDSGADDASGAAR